jgi:hypothetical protein
MALALCSSVVAACGGRSSNGSGAQPPTSRGANGVQTPPLVATGPQRDACTLVTQVEVEAAVGAKVTAARPGGQGTGGSACNYALAAGPDQAVALVSTTSPGSAAAFDADRQRAIEPVRTVSAGDRAFVAGGQGVVLKGTTIVVVLVATKQAQAAQELTATKLIQAAAARL